MFAPIVVIWLLLLAGIGKRTFAPIVITLKGRH
jgi:hypothetical protein